MFASMGSLAQIVLLHTVGLNLDRTYSGPHLDPKMLTLNVSHTRSRVDGAKQSQPPLLLATCAPQSSIYFVILLLIEPPIEISIDLILDRTPMIISDCVS
ncbi:hypothetical protein BLOT_012634 [Blomia tropicalis]|nr:hypothetical protein BLOT_012634 [Blomia tropicalis]